MFGKQQYMGFIAPNRMWTPEFLPGKEAWYDMADPSTVILNGSNVSQLSDISGNNNHAVQAAAASQPLYGTNFVNGLNTVTASSDYMSLTSSLTNVKAAFFVTSGLAGSTANTSLAPILGATGAPQDHTFIRTNAVDYDISINGSASNSGNASVNGGNLVSGSDISLGLSIPDKAGDLFWYADYDNNARVDDLLAILTASITLVGSIGEIVLLNSIPSLEDRQKMEGYLAWKWGLAGKLPGSHPYKNNHPRV